MLSIQRFVQERKFSSYIPLNDEDVRQALTRAIEDEENGLKTYQTKIDEDANDILFYTKSR